MEILILIAVGVLFSSSALLLYLYLNILNKSKETISELKDEVDKSSTKFKNLKDELEILKDELSSKKIGFYEDKVNLLSAEDRAAGKNSEQYKLVVHVKELDRYTNGLSKIQIIKLDVMSGYDHEQYEWVKHCIKERFVSIKKTVEITWLESEENLKEIRKQKLAKIENLKSKLS